MPPALTCLSFSTSSTCQSYSSLKVISTGSLRLGLSSHKRYKPSFGIHPDNYLGFVHCKRCQVDPSVELCGIVCRGFLGHVSLLPVFRYQVLGQVVFPRGSSSACTPSFLG